MSLFEWRLQKMPKLITLLLCTFFTGFTWASNSEFSSVVDKLNETAVLAAQETANVLNAYLALGIELQRINTTIDHLATYQRRNLRLRALKAHRSASLEYLTPNQYRRWMRVATRALPQLNRGGASVYVGPVMPVGEYAAESPATVSYRASRGN